MLLFVIFDEKKFGYGSDFPAIFQAFLLLERILLLMVQVRKVVANGVVFLTLVLLLLVQFSNQKQEFLPMVHSCLWCCNTRCCMHVLNCEKNCIKSDFKDIFLNLQQMNEVTRHFC